jgi:hypothetical protein
MKNKTFFITTLILSVLFGTFTYFSYKLLMYLLYCLITLKIQ